MCVWVPPGSPPHPLSLLVQARSSGGMGSKQTRMRMIEAGAAEVKQDDRTENSSFWEKTLSRDLRGC